jgi:hypothetical protein
MTDQTSLPGLTPAEQRVQDVKNRLVAMARELSSLDVHAFANAAKRDTWEEELAVAALDFKRRLRECGVIAELAMLAYLEPSPPSEQQ